MTRPASWLATLLLVVCCGTTASPVATTSVADLPLLELPAESEAGDTFAILLSGDGGWSALDKAVASALNTHGVAVVGWDSLRYFWSPRTPADTAPLVKATALIVMGSEAFFEFHVSHWIITPKGGLPTRPEVVTGRLGAVFCIYGKGDDSACRGLRGPEVHEVALAGGHHFDGDYTTLAAAIVSALAL